MSPLDDNLQGRSRTLITSYGVVIAAVAFAIVVVVVMNRFQGLVEDSLEGAALEYEDALQYSALVRHIEEYAQESTEVLARSGEIPDRAVHEQAARRILAALAKAAEESARTEGQDAAAKNARQVAEVADAFEAFVRRIDELARMDRAAPDYQAKVVATFDDFLRQKLLGAINKALEAERENAHRTVAEYRADASQWTRGMSLLIFVLIGLMAIPLFLRIDRGIRRLAEGASKIAAGDYSTRVEVRGMFRPIADAFNGMARRVYDHQLAQLEMAKQLQASSAELLAVAKQTETNAADESAAVEQTRRTMAALLAAATEIAESADKVAASADQSTRASDGIGEQILKLTAQSQKIRKITAVIQGIADKSDVLALNASLEGAKAGDAGRGFVLLGGEMRRLAESVSSAANEAGDLAFEIEELSKRAVLSTEVGQKLAAATLDIARRINLITGQQRGATEQVTRSMEDVHRYTQHSLSAAKQTRATASDLVKTSDELEKLVKASANGLEERA